MTDFDVTTDASTTTETGLYADADKADAEGKQTKSVAGDSSDEVDPRKLVRDPTLSELRWYYRRTFAKVLVNKPIEDAFKNGLEFTSENAAEARDLIEQPRFGRDGDFLDAYQMAQKKARRDGFALIFMGTKDSTNGVHESPISQDIQVDSISHLKVLTIDDLSGSASGEAHQQIRRETGLEREQYEVRQTGIVINTDITSPMYREPIGYILDSHPSQFIHADRILHYTWNPEVDGDYEHSDRISRWNERQGTLGMYEGDSVLVPSYDLMKGIAKGNWAVMQALFRNASHMYSVKVPPDADKDEFNAAVSATTNINAKSAMVLPSTEYDMQQFESGNEIDPTNFFDVVFDQVCAVHEMTKSVLFGTQAGTVSGSEVDVKNYYSKVERFRTTRGTRDVLEYLTQARRMLDGRTSTEYEYDADIEWGPLFKVDDETRIGMFQTASQAMTTLIGNYVLTPDEARELLTGEFTQIDLDSLTEDQMDVLDRLNLAQVGQFQGAEANDPSPDTNPRQGGQQGGRPEGARQSPESSGATPSADRLSELHDEGIIDDEQFIEAVKYEQDKFDSDEEGHDKGEE